MTLKANISLKRGAIVAAILWTCWVAMRFVLAHMRRSPDDGDGGEEVRPWSLRPLLKRHLRVWGEAQP